MGTVVKIAYGQGGSVTGLLGARLLIAVAIWGLLLNRRLWRLEWSSSPIRRLLVAGAMGVGMASLGEYAAYRYVPIALVVLVLFMSPGWVAVTQWLRFGEPIGVLGIAGLGLLAVGLILLTQASMGGASLTGVVLALGASFGIATVFVLAAESIHEVAPSVAAAVMAIGAAAVALPVAAIDKTLVSTLTSPFLARSGFLLAVVGTVVGFFLLLRGIRQLGAFSASVASAVEPIFAALLAWVFVGQALTRGQILGGALIIMGTAVVSRRDDSVGEAVVERNDNDEVIGRRESGIDDI